MVKRRVKLRKSERADDSQFRELENRELVCQKGENLLDSAG